MWSLTLLNRLVNEGRSINKTIQSLSLVGMLNVKCQCQSNETTKKMWENNYFIWVSVGTGILSNLYRDISLWKYLEYCFLKTIKVMRLSEGILFHIDEVNWKKNVVIVGCRLWGGGGHKLLILVTKFKQQLWSFVQIISSVPHQ